MSPPAQREIEPSGDLARLVRGAGAVAATYAYFLVFAQFGLLRAMEAELDRGHIAPALAAMGAAGILGSILVAQAFDASRARRLMVAGYLIAAAPAALAVGTRTPTQFIAMSALTGLGTGAVTVGLAAMLRRQVGECRLGRCIGWGTGMAYALCNLPGIFDAAPAAQALIGAGAALAGLVLVAGFSPASDAPLPTPGPGTGYAVPRAVPWIGGFAVLVSADSAMFHQIQHTPALRAEAWTEPAQLWLNASAHLVAGVVAGTVFDRGRLVAAMITSMPALVIGGALCFTGHGSVGAPLYAAAVSAYSAGLVYFPARAGRPALAAWVYAMAGWIGSAAGIAIVEQMN